LLRADDMHLERGIRVQSKHWFFRCTSE
jgi:hypothetical protein